MVETMDLFTGTLNDLANGPHLRGRETLTRALMTRLAEKGLTLDECAGRLMMDRKRATLEAHARKYGLAFPDYVPMTLRKVLAFHQRGDFYELRGEHVEAVAKLLDIAVTGKGDSRQCAFPVHSADECRQVLQANWFIVKLVKQGKRKAKENG